MEPSFIINVGSYEKALYGYDAMFNPHYADQQKLKSKGQMKDEVEEFKFLMRPIYAYMPHTGCIKTLASNEKYLASASTDEMIKIYDLTKRIEVGTLTQHEGLVTALQFWKNKYLFSSSMDGSLVVWRTKDWDIVQILKHKAPILAMSVHPSGKLCLTAGNDKKMKLWDLQSGKCASTMPLEHDPEMIQWSPEGTTFAVLVNQQILIYSAKTGKAINTLKEPKRINSIAYMSENVLASGGENRQINVWQIYEGICLHVLTGFENRVKNLFAINKPENQKQKNAQYPYLISTSSDCSVKIWDLDESTKESIAETYIDDSRITCLTSSFVVDMQVKNKADGEADSSDEEAEEDVSEEDQKKPAKNSKKRKRDHFVVVEQEENGSDENDGEADENSEDNGVEFESDLENDEELPELDEEDSGMEEDGDNNGMDEEEDEEEEVIEQPKKIAKKVKDFDVKKQNKANNKANKNKNKKQPVANTKPAEANKPKKVVEQKQPVAASPKNPNNNNNKKQSPVAANKPATNKPAANKPKPASTNAKNNNNKQPLKGILKKK